MRPGKNIDGHEISNRKKFELNCNRAYDRCHEKSFDSTEEKKIERHKSSIVALLTPLS